MDKATCVTVCTSDFIITVIVFCLTCLFGTYLRMDGKNTKKASKAKNSRIKPCIPEPLEFFRDYEAEMDERGAPRLAVGSDPFISGGLVISSTEDDDLPLGQGNRSCELTRS